MLKKLFAARDPWALIDQLAGEWTGKLAAECEALFGSADDEGRKRLIWLLERVRNTEAHAILLRRLPLAAGDEAAQILRALNGSHVVVPSEQITRLFKDASVEAVAAAGISGDVSLAPRIVPFLKKANVRRHAALALAMLGRKEYAATIAGHIETSENLDPYGLVVALEQLNDPSVVPKLLELLLKDDVAYTWDLHHAVWRLTGREPLVRLERDPKRRATAFREAWKGFDLSALPQPRLSDVHINEATASVSFNLVDGFGTVRIDYDPPTPGSSWPRWGKSLFVGNDRLFEIGSDCGTCETTLRFSGSGAVSAAGEAEVIRSALSNVQTITKDLLQALEPYLTKLRTGHYVARLVDLDLERVTRPEDSWLTKRVEHRKDEESGEAYTPEPTDVSWPGLEHFQVRNAAIEAFPTYGLLLPQAPLNKLQPDVEGRWQSAISDGARPAAMALCWAEQKDVQGRFAERFLVGLVLDGHHKLAAYTRLQQPARVVAICRVEDSWGPPENPAEWLNEALGSLAETKSTH